MEIRSAGEEKPLDAPLHQKVNHVARRPPGPFCAHQRSAATRAKALQGELDLPVPEGQAALLQAPDARWRVWASLRLYRGILDVIEQHDYDVFNHRA